MKEFIKRHVINNWGYKLLSLGIAIVCWILFTNMENPIRTLSFEVPVEVLHEDEFFEQGRYLEIEGSTDFSNLRVEVYLKARSSVMESLRYRNASAFLRAYIDLYELDSSDPNRLIIHYEITDSTVNAELDSVRNRSYYTVTVEDTVSKEIPIAYEISGEPEDGYMYVENDSDITVTPSTVTVTGPSSEVDTLSQGKVAVDISGANANINVVSTITFCDADGNDVSLSSYTEAAVKEASVFVPIYTYKSVPIETKLTGTAQDGYEYSGDVSCNFTQASIYGPESVLNKIEAITLPDIDLSTITGEYSQKFDLQEVLNTAYGDNTVRLMENAPQEVTVTLSVEKQVSRTVTIDTSSISVNGINSSWNYTFNDETVELTIVGLEDKVDSFDTSLLMPSVRFTSSTLTAGLHTMPIEFSEFTGVEVKDATVRITLSSRSSDGSSSGSSTSSGSN